MKYNHFLSSHENSRTLFEGKHAKTEVNSNVQVKHEGTNHFKGRWGERRGVIIQRKEYWIKIKRKGGGDAN